MVEQTSALLDERDTKLPRGLENRPVVLASTWCGNVFGTRASGTEDVVDEGELFV